MKQILLAGCILLMAGCSTLPDELQVKEGTNLLSYQQVSANPQQTAGNQVRWGGVIAEVTNKQDATLVEVVHYPLRSYGRPSVSDDSMGRFRVYIDGFLDPMVFKPGRSLTITGKVLGSETDRVGEHDYVFPAIKADGYHLWREVQQVDVTTFGFGYYPYPYHGWYGWHMWPYHQRVIIRSRTPVSVGHPSPSRPDLGSDDGRAPEVLRPRNDSPQVPRIKRNEMGKIQQH
ncbi:Slp family lipoprotein [Bowmanella dokdonensis]|uniref:Slp family lipoprotein n=1 Tax=Bowmanella dokdonensis TaxID=751969 RepID=A0A939DLY3_9ALTE|nr:Slp family lipoprotein [Bowmanella dokdonensis]MBN7825020.1 Slp family lipoprotein [Bowmanella dokdonensis]